MEKNMDKDYLKSVVIPGLIKDGITLEQVSAELNYRDVTGVVDSHAGWDDDLIDYSTRELEAIEAVWSEGSIEMSQVQDGFAVGLARQLRDLMEDLIENGDGFWEDLSIRLPIVREGLDGYGMVIRAVEDDARDQFFLVSVYEGFSEKENGKKVMHGCTDYADLDELEAVTRGLLERVCPERDILAYESAHERMCKCKACGSEIDIEDEEGLWGHLQMEHEEIFEACQDWDTPDMIQEYYDVSGVMDMDLDNDEEIGEVLTLAASRKDIVEYLGQQEDEYFAERGTTKDQVLQDQALIETLAVEHMRCVNRYGNEREWSCKDACDVKPGIHMDMKDSLSQKIKDAEGKKQGIICSDISSKDDLKR